MSSNLEMYINQPFETQKIAQIFKSRVFLTVPNWTSNYPGAPYLGYQAKSEMAHHSPQVIHRIQTLMFRTGNISIDCMYFRNTLKSMRSHAPQSSKASWLLLNSKTYHRRITQKWHLLTLRKTNLAHLFVIAKSLRQFSQFCSMFTLRKRKKKLSFRNYLYLLLVACYYR